MEESGSNLKRAALYGVAGLMTAAIGASAVSVLAAEDDKKPEAKPAAQSAPVTPKASEPAPPPAPKPVPVPQAETAPAPEQAPPVAPAVAPPVAPRVVQPVVPKPALKPLAPRPAVAAVKVEQEPAAPDAGPSAVSSAQAQVSGAGTVSVHVSPAQPVKKPSPTDEALKKAKSEATEAKKKVKHAEKQLDEAKKDYEKKKGEIKKIQKQQKEEKKDQKAKPKPKPPVAPVLTKKTSPDMEKRLKVHTSKQKSGKKVTISVSSSAHSG